MSAQMLPLYAPAMLNALRALCEQRHLLLTRAGVAGYRQTSTGEWVADPASEAFANAAALLAEIDSSIE